VKATLEGMTNEIRKEVETLVLEEDSVDGGEEEARAKCEEALGENFVRSNTTENGEGEVGTKTDEGNDICGKVEHLTHRAAEQAVKATLEGMTNEIRKEVETLVTEQLNSSFEKIKELNSQHEDMKSRLSDIEQNKTINQAKQNSKSKSGQSASSNGVDYLRQGGDLIKNDEAQGNEFLGHGPNQNKVESGENLDQMNAEDMEELNEILDIAPTTSVSAIWDLIGQPTTTEPLDFGGLLEPGLMQICVNTEETHSGTFLSISNIFLACVRRMERSACPVNVLFNACAYIFVVCLTAAPENMQTLGQLKHHELASSLAEIVIDTLVECPHTEMINWSFMLASEKESADLESFQEMLKEAACTFLRAHFGHKTIQ